jgi:hypothetical protein
MLGAAVDVSCVRFPCSWGCRSWSNVMQWYQIESCWRCLGCSVGRAIRRLCVVQITSSSSWSRRCHQYGGKEAMGGYLPHINRLFVVFTHCTQSCSRNTTVSQLHAMISVVPLVSSIIGGTMAAGDLLLLLWSRRCHQYGGRYRWADTSPTSIVTCLYFNAALLLIGTQRTQNYTQRMLLSH